MQRPASIAADRAFKGITRHWIENAKQFVLGQNLGYKADLDYGHSTAAKNG